MLDVTKAIIAAVEKLIAGWEDLKKDGKISPETLLNLIYELIGKANVVIAEASSGHLKEQMVIDAFAYFDDKYKLIERLDQKTNLPWWLEAFDQKLFREALRVIIRVMVKAVNKSKRVSE
jgi:hypothetical protein